MTTRLPLIGALLPALVWSGAASAQDLSALDKRMTGPRAKVVVLGSVHLSGMPKGAKPTALDPLLARLAAFKPDVITVEAIPGEACDMMSRQPASYEPQDIARYCPSTDEAKAATGLEVAAATAEVHRTLAAWPAQPTPAQRRRLAALFLAAGDGASALTQWLQLPTAERRAGDSLNDALVARLRALESRQPDGETVANRTSQKRPSEVHLVAARLAARLGLQRVFPIDDHTGDAVDIPDAQVQSYAQAIQRAWEAASAPAAPMRERQQTLLRSGDLLALYRFINRPDVLQTVVDGDFGAALRDGSPERYGQIYVAGWETRNLRMVANIRAAFRERPGARVLALVGSSHKPWFDRLLGAMQGVDVVDVEKVLAAPAPEEAAHP